MKNYTNKEIESLITRFEAQQLPKAEWTHEAHLVVAIWYCSKYNFEEALNLVRRNITLHNESVGTPNTDDEGYHETVTKFWLLTAEKFLKDKACESMSELVNGFINSDISASDFPLKFYTKDVLFSVQARHKWIEPEIAKL